MSTILDSMDDLIWEAQREAYYYVERGFRAQSVADLSLKQELLLASLRKELTISEDDNRNIRRSLNNDRILISIREIRQGETGSASHQRATQGMPQPLHGAFQTDSSPETETTRPRKTRSMNDLLSMPSPDKGSRVKGKDKVIPYRKQHNRGHGSDNDTAGALRIRFTVGGRIPSPRSVKEQDNSDDDSDYSGENSDTEDDDPDSDEN